MLHYRFVCFIGYMRATTTTTDRHSDQGTTRTDEEKNTARIYFQSEKRKGTGRQGWQVRWGWETDDERKGTGEVQRSPSLANNNFSPHGFPSWANHALIVLPSALSSLLLYITRNPDTTGNPDKEENASNR